MEGCEGALGVTFALLASDYGFQLMLFTLIKRCCFFMERDLPQKGCKCVHCDPQALAKIYNCVQWFVCNFGGVTRARFNPHTNTKQSDHVRLLKSYTQIIAQSCKS